MADKKKCNRRIQLEEPGTPYPRTCPECKLGPCPFYSMQPTKGDEARSVWVLAPVTETDGLQDPWMAFEDEATCNRVHQAMNELPSGQVLRKSEVLLWRLGMPPEGPIFKEPPQ